MTFTYFADLAAQVPEVPADSILSRTLLTSDGLKVIVFKFAAGQELSEHTAAMPAIIHILRGEARLTLGGEVYAAGVGAWAHMAAGLPHSVFAQTPVTLLLLMLK